MMGSLYPLVTGLPKEFPRVSGRGVTTKCLVLLPPLQTPFKPPGR